MPATPEVPPASTVVVVCGGDPLRAAERLLVATLPDDVLVIAADSGIDRAREAGLAVHRAVGDFDSVTAEGLAWAEASGAVICRHPAAKDATDLELALVDAAAAAPRRVIVLGGAGGRLDHLLGNVSLLGHPILAATEVEWRQGGTTTTVIRQSARLCGEPGSLVSLIPLHGLVTGVVTDGLAYPLRDEDLPAGTSRGISNVFLADSATVSVRSGVLLAIQPPAEGEA